MTAASPKTDTALRSISDTTFEQHYSIGDLAERWRTSRETVRLLVAAEPDVVKIRMGKKQANTRYSVPESVARRIHTRLFNPPAKTHKN